MYKYILIYPNKLKNKYVSNYKYFNIKEYLYLYIKIQGVKHIYINIYTSIYILSLLQFTCDIQKYYIYLYKYIYTT